MNRDNSSASLINSDPVILNQIKESLSAYYQSLGLKNIDGMVSARLKMERSRRILGFLRSRGIDVAGKKVLDVGCGWGEFLVCLEKFGAASITGVEPDQGLVEISKKLSPFSNVFQGFSEVLPFGTGEFDMVVSSDVIEHVDNADISLAEMIRVLKPGGHLFLNFPNYAYFEESHYKMAFPPGGFKWLGRMYLVLKRRNPDFFIRCVNPISYGKVMSTLKLFDVTVSAVHDELHPRVASGGFKKWFKSNYVKCFGPPVVSLIIQKNSHARSIDKIKFV